MDRKIVWTEKASGDIEVIFRYIARRDPGAALASGSASTIAHKFFSNILKLEPFSMSCATAVGES